ncbi:DUF6470 family protein [Rossellomorea marisflavi]|uniref:DUF6470 family protein n=1 Tax=Rossellomorea marisflavi TaxID=189381 RepID=UPI00296FB01F|nr:DUF6470 family protein [Rossellomorea marisflavi]MDW4528208.1 DUF6470 family protein [Rossellomorea marisflavi]
MNIPQIRIQSINATISISTTPGQFDMQQPNADVDIQQPQAKMYIERTPSKLTIDQSEARADMDLKSIRRRIEDFANQGYQDWLEGMARVSGDGDELMMIENGGNALTEQAERNSTGPIYDFNIGFIPSAGSVKIGYDPGSVRVNIEPQRVINNTRTNKPIVDFTPAKVNVGMQRYADLKIDWVAPGENLNKGM